MLEPGGRRNLGNFFAAPAGAAKADEASPDGLASINRYKAFSGTKNGVHFRVHL